MTLTLQTVSCILKKPTQLHNPDKQDIHFPHHQEEEKCCQEITPAQVETSSTKFQYQDDHSRSQIGQNAETSQWLVRQPFHAGLRPPTILNPHFIKSSRDKYINPIIDAGLQQVILPVECGHNEAFMYLNRLCQGSKGPCILFKNCYWLTPNEFQFISGRETAKDWKRSIRHNGKSIKLLINKGILNVHSPLCECGATAASSMKMGLFPLQSMEKPNFQSRTFRQETEETEEGSSGFRLETGLSNGASWYSSYGLMSSAYNCGRNLDIPTARGKERSSPTEGWESAGSGETDGINSSNTHSSTSPRSIGTLPDASSSLDQKLAGHYDHEGISSPVSRYSTVSTMSSTLTAAESQSEESSITGSGVNMNNNNESPTPPKSKRKSKAMAVKSERHSPQLSSSTSPPMTPPPSNSSSGQHPLGSSSPPPQPPIKQMEQMMGTGRNYSDFMRSLAAKYNNQQPASNTDFFSRASPAFGFDTRFLKPSTAAALLNLSCSQLPPTMFGTDKDKFPLIDMSSTQTLLSMVRSASAAAATNLETLKANQLNHKRPNSPLDLSSRDMPNTTPPLKKNKLRNPLLDMTALGLKAAAAAATVAPVCLSSCSSGCTEEAQTMINWSVDEVCRFVGTIELCKEYVEVFREHSIDGSSLPLLTEEHLMNAMNMKLGPALKLRSTIAKKLGNCVVCSHCTHCHNHSNSSSSP